MCSTDMVPKSRTGKNGTQHWPWLRSEFFSNDLIPIRDFSSLLTTQFRISNNLHNKTENRQSYFFGRNYKSQTWLLLYPQVVFCLLHALDVDDHIIVEKLFALLLVEVVNPKILFYRWKLLSHSILHFICVKFVDVARWPFRNIKKIY